MLRRLRTLLVLSALTVLTAAPPAAADPAQPTDFRSTINAVTPDTPAIKAGIVGGDAFLDLEVERGHLVQVDGYQGEPYLRVLKGGAVQENRNSPASYINRDRLGAAVPASLNGDTLPPPAWRTIAENGRFVWHDHRIHFMGKSPTPALRSGQAVAWVVGLTVDGRPVQIQGNYRYETAPNPFPWIGLAGALLVIAVAAGRRWPLAIAAGSVTAAGLTALSLGWQENLAIPDGAGANPLTVVLPAVAVVAGALATIQRRPPMRVIAVLAAAAALGGWVLTRATIFTKAVLPTALSANLDRGGTAVAAGLTVAAAILAVRSGALAMPTAGPTAGPTEGPDAGNDAGDPVEPDGPLTTSPPV